MTITTTEQPLATCQIAPGKEVQPLDCPQPMFGLQSTADVNPISDVHEENGVFWLPYACEAADIYCNHCSIPGDPKTYNEQGAIKFANPFAVYGSFKCSTVGFSLDEAKKRARRNLEYGQWRAVEKQFWTNLSTDPDIVDLNPGGTSSSIVMGIAALEDYAGTHIGCLPTLHGPRGLVPTMSNASLFPTTLGDKQMRTYLGSLFAAGGGYTNVGPGGVLAGPGEAWAYVTGPVRIWEGDIFDTPPAADKNASAIDRSNNTLLALAERVILIGRECAGAAILVKADQGCGCC